MRRHSCASIAQGARAVHGTHQAGGLRRSSWRWARRSRSPQRRPRRPPRAWRETQSAAPWKRVSAGSRRAVSRQLCLASSSVPLQSVAATTKEWIGACELLMRTHAKRCVFFSFTFGAHFTDPREEMRDACKKMGVYAFENVQMHEKGTPSVSLTHTRWPVASSHVSAPPWDVPA